MRQVTLPIGELGLIALTRAMLAAGVFLLVADRISPRKRREFGVPLLLIGALSTAPLLMDVLRRAQQNSSREPLADEATTALPNQAAFLSK